MRTLRIIFLPLIPILTLTNLSAQVTNWPPTRTLVKLVPDYSRPRVYGLDKSSSGNPGTLLAFDATNGSTLSVISVGISPTDMVITPTGDALYVINTGSRTISKVNLDAFTVVDAKSITTPNASDPTNPLHLVLGKTNFVYYTDGAWAPNIYALDFNTGTNLLVYNANANWYVDPQGTACPNGVGGMVPTRDGNTLFTWLQYGWNAGWARSVMTRLDATTNPIIPLESGPIQWRDPLDTPILLNDSETLVFSKVNMVAATNVSLLLSSFSENIYAISSDGAIAFGGTNLFKSSDGTAVTNLPFASIVQSVSGTGQKLFRYNGANSTLVVYDMAALMGLPTQVTNPVPGDTAVVNIPMQVLTWSPSKAALRYNVYFGTNVTAVMNATTNSPLYLGTTEATNFPLPTALSPGATHYWRVDAVGFSSITAGALWSFSASPVVVEPQALNIRSLVGLPMMSQQLSFGGASGTDWNLAIAQSWMTASVTNGITPGSATLQFAITNLPAGIYTNVITLYSSNVVLQYPVVVSLTNLNASQMVADRNRDYIYVLHPGTSKTNDAFLLFLNITNGNIEKVMPIGINPTDMTINAHEDRLYVSNWKSDKTRVVDLVNQVELPPLLIGTEINRINAGRAGRIVTEGQGLGNTNPLNPQSIYNTTDGTLLFTRQFNGGDGECESTGNYYYYGFPNPHLIYKYNISADNFVEVNSAAGNNFVTSGVLVTPDDSRIIFCGNVYNTNLNLLSAIGTGIYACNSNATIVFGSTQVYTPGSTTPIHNLPVATSALAVDRADQNVWYFNGTTKRIESLALTIVRSPKVVQQPPTNTVVITGTDPSLSPTVLGMPPLAFQWTFGGTNLPGATNSSLSITGIQPSQEGDYQLIVTNLYGTVTSILAHVTVLIPVTITEHPQGTNVPAGQSFTLSVMATGSPVLSNRWTFEGVNISGATNFTLSISNAQIINEGIYRAVVQNAVGSVASAVALVRVIPSSPTILKQPISKSVGASSNAVFTVSAIGSQPLSYQWFFNGSPIVGATGAQYQLSNVQTQNAGDFQVVVTNSVGVVTSTVATLTVSPVAPYFVVQPVGTSLPAGTNLTLNAVANGSEPISYEWRLNGTNLIGRTQTSLAISNLNLTDSGDYTVLASNSVDIASSLVATVVITAAPPVFIEQPISVVTFGGSITNLNSLAIGSTPLWYQWYFENSPLPNQTNRQLIFNPVTLAAVGSYFVTASNAFASATSVVVQVTVNQSPIFQQGLSNRVVDVGSTVVLGVQVTASDIPSYTWRFNNNQIATNSVVILTNIQTVQSGYYRVTVANQYGSVSSTGRVSVLGPPSWVIAWGDNSGGQTNVPANLDDVVAVTGGDYHTLALRRNGALLSWGYNGEGQISVPTNTLRFVSIASGEAHNLALKENGTVTAWGRNDFGQCNVPASAILVLAVAAGDSHSAALLSSGAVVCWGDNTFRQVSGSVGLSGIRAITAGRNHNLALRNNGTVAGWGFNAYGQSSPPQGLSGVAAIAAGYLHSVALLSNTTVVAWGDNTYGQTNTPPGLSNVVAVAAGDFHTFALLQYGSVLAWGNNWYGQTDVAAAVTNAVAVSSGNYHGLALVPVIPLLRPYLGPAGLVIEWSGPGVLQWSPTPAGPYTDLPGLWRSYTNIDMSPQSKFFRLRR